MKRFFKKLLGYLFYTIFLMGMIIEVVAFYSFACILHWLWLIPAVVYTALLINFFFEMENRL